MINRFLKLAILGLSSSVSLSLSAASLDSQELIQGYQEFDWKGASYEEVQAQFSSYSNFMRSSRSVDDYRLKEKWMVNFLYETYPGMKGYWNDAYVFDDMSVVQADGLIDLERNIVGKSMLGASIHPGSVQQSPRISDGASYPVLKTSLSRMKSGLAPVGPDNKPLLLCKLNDDSRAMYFEVSEQESWRLLNAMGTGMTATQACLDEEMIPYYWKSRAKNLLDVRSNIVRSKRSHVE